MPRTWPVFGLLLLANCAGSGSTRPPVVPPAPGEPPKPPPATVTLCHVEEEETSWLSRRMELPEDEVKKHLAADKYDYRGECDPSWRPPGRPPRPPAPSPEPEKPTPKPDRVTLCHHFDRENEQGGKDRGRETITVNPKNADWHLCGHKPCGDRQGPDYEGKCKEREP